MKKLFLLMTSFLATLALWGMPEYIPDKGKSAIVTNLFADTLIQLNVTVCDEDLPYFFDNQSLTEPGTYWDTLQTISGGDSIVQLSLLVKCCQTATNNPNFADVCTEAPLLCASFMEATPFDLNNSTADVPGNLAAQFCYPVNHSRWLRFVACAPSVTLALSVQNCSGNTPAQEGVEIALFATFDCVNFTRIGDCYQTFLGQTQTMQFDGLIPGVEYYLFADGISAEVCAFRLNLLAGINSGIPDNFVSSGTATDGMINGDKDVCPGQIAVYTLTPPTCKVTIPEFTCPPPDDACGFCGTVFELDSVTYKWHIPDCARFLGDSTGLSVEIIYDQCIFFTDTVVVQQIWVEAIWTFSDTFFVQTDTLVFCDCFPGSRSCGNIPPCDVGIHFDVEDVFLTIPCVGPPPQFLGVTYDSPGTFTQFNVPNCLLFVIHVDKEPGPQITATPPVSIINCIITPTLQANSTGQITWFPPFGNPVNNSSIVAFQPGVYTAIATDANGCTSAASVTVMADFIIPVAHAGSDQVLCANELPVQLQAIPGGPDIWYQWSNGASGPNPIVNQAVGTVTYTLTVTNTSNGCTSTDNVTVTVDPQLITTLPPVSLCQGDCFTLGGELFCPTGPSGPVQVVLSSFSGCDSVVLQPFFLLPTTILQLGIIAKLNCNLTQVSLHGEIYNSPGNYMVETGPCTYEAFTILQDIQTKSLTLQPKTLCPGECFTFHGQTICPQPGDVPPSIVLIGANGCDSIVTQPFVFQAPDTVQMGQVALLNCAVTSVTYLGATYTQPGAYTIQIDPCTVEQFSIGQDIQSPPPTMLADVSVCPGECFMFNGQTVCPQAGDTPPSMILTAANGCDSIVTQPFVFQAPDTVQIGQVALLNCAVTSATYLGVTYTQPGAYTIQIDPCTVEQFSIGQDIQSSPP
ncbi:MAG TPA: hypothetical protein VK168_21365, partial [Saprospiraceae bacterium]|nr:hypothetical protein [Saprospiraceae bacterium]